MWPKQYFGEQYDSFGHQANNHFGDQKLVAKTIVVLVTNGEYLVSGFGVESTMLLGTSAGSGGHNIPLPLDLMSTTSVSNSITFIDK